MHQIYSHTHPWNKKKQHLLACTTNRTEIAEYWKIKELAFTKTVHLNVRYQTQIFINLLDKHTEHT